FSSPTTTCGRRWRLRTGRTSCTRAAFSWTATRKRSRKTSWLASVIWEIGFGCDAALLALPAGLDRAAVVRRLAVYRARFQRRFVVDLLLGLGLRRAGRRHCQAHLAADARDCRLHVSDGGAPGGAADAEPAVGQQRDRGHAGGRRQLLPHRRAGHRRGPAGQRREPGGGGMD